MKPSDFIAIIGPAAQASAAKTRIPASFVVAQAALESGWGESRLSREGKNLFGVKADRAWTGPTVSMMTKEFRNGAWISEEALWRKYDDWQGSIDDHAEFFKRNSRYARCFDSVTGEGWALAVAQAGYATDPGYAGKLVSLIRDYKLTSLDFNPPVPVFPAPIEERPQQTPTPLPELSPAPVASGGLFGWVGGLFGVFKYGRALASGNALQNTVALTATLVGLITSGDILARHFGYDAHLSAVDIQYWGEVGAVVLCSVAGVVRVVGSKNAGFKRFLWWELDPAPTQVQADTADVQRPVA